MKKYFEAEGVNCETAIENALKALALDRDDVEVEVLTVGKKGIFRSTPARVRVGYEVPEELEKIKQARPDPVTKRAPITIIEMPGNAQATPGNAQATPVKVQSTPINVQATPINAQATPGNAQATPGNAQATPGNAQATPGNAQATPGNAQATPQGKPRQSVQGKPFIPRGGAMRSEISTKSPAYVQGTPLPKDKISTEGLAAICFIDGLLERLHIEGHTEILDSSDTNHLQVNIVGPEMGAIIGRRGDTLDAIQYLTMLVVGRGGEEHTRVSVDAENYREKREESLTRLARKMASKVTRYHKSMTLEPMNPYERRIIHATLQEYRGVTTFSTGTEPGRRIVIAPEGQNGYRGGNRGGYAQRGEDRR